MGQRAGQKEAGRAKILASAGRGFRRHGYGGLGVDGLARDAGVTSGAFYAHFPSKAEAFRAAVAAGMADVRDAILGLRARHGDGWAVAFIDTYLGSFRTCDLAVSCALQNLSGEVARADEATRSVYETALREVVDATEAGLDGPPDIRRARATALLATLAGGVTLARAVREPGTSVAIASAVRQAALALVAPGGP